MRSAAFGIRNSDTVQGSHKRAQIVWLDFSVGCPIFVVPDNTRHIDIWGEEAAEEKPLTCYTIRAQRFSFRVNADRRRA
jgi:hypothetical protein